MAGALSKKYGGVPLWGYLGAGTVLIGGVLYVRNKNAKAAAAAAAAPASGAGSTAGTGAATTPYGPATGGGISSDTLAAILASQGQGSTVTASTAPSTPSYTAPTGEVLSGGGYYSPSSSAPVQDANGASYQQVQNVNQLQELAAQGQTAYIQILPGVFINTTPNQSLAPNTPLYQKIG